MSAVPPRVDTGLKEGDWVLSAIDVNGVDKFDERYTTPRMQTQIIKSGIAALVGPVETQTVYGKVIHTPRSLGTDSMICHILHSGRGPYVQALTKGRVAVLIPRSSVEVNRFCVYNPTKEGYAIKFLELGEMHHISAGHIVLVYQAHEAPKHADLVMAIVLSHAKELIAQSDALNWTRLLSYTHNALLRFWQGVNNPLSPNTYLKSMVIPLPATRTPTMSADNPNAAYMNGLMGISDGRVGSVPLPPVIPPGMLRSAPPPPSNPAPTTAFMFGAPQAPSTSSFTFGAPQAPSTSSFAFGAPQAPSTSSFAFGAPRGGGNEQTPAKRQKPPT